jgi:hypothetical protein
MKKTKTLLVLAAASLLGIGMVGCGGGGEESSTEASSYLEVSVIKNSGVPSVLVGSTVDFDEYITVTLADGTTSKEYTLSCSDATLSIDGHKVTPTEIKSYTVTVSSGDRQIRVTLNSKSELGLKVEEFVTPLASTPMNYTIDVYDTDDSGNLVYGNYTVLHNENYSVAYNKDNLGETSTASDGTVSAASTIFAKLSNGKGYWGEFNTDGVPVFSAPSTEFPGLYYFSGENPLTAGDFTSTFTTSGSSSAGVSTTVETIAAGATAATNFFMYGFGVPVSKNFDLTSLAVVGFGDSIDGDDNEEDTLLMAILAVPTETGVAAGLEEGQTYLYTYLGLHSIGSSSVAEVEAAIADDSYIPVPIDSTEAQTVFAGDNGIVAAHNYTATLDVKGVDGDGNAVTDHDGISTFFGMSSDFRITSTVTSDGIILALDTVSGDTATPYSKMAFYNQDSKAYQANPYVDASASDATWDGTTMEVTELTSTTDVWSIDSILGLSLQNVVASDFTDIEWASRSEDADANTVTLEGASAGDNDGTTDTTGLFRHVFGSLDAFFGYSTGTFTDIWTAASDGWGSSDAKHAYVWESNFNSFTVNTATNDVTVDFTLYLPFSDISNNYIEFALTVTNVGATTNDFNFTTPSTGESSSASSSEDTGSSSGETSSESSSESSSAAA